ncbi:MAG: nucleotidyl transferase AbiEii/AbiGii toxin family protein [Thermoguttaceae bacterium]
MQQHENDIAQTIKVVNSLLAELNVSYHFTGGIISGFYGEPRYTQDIDIVILISYDKLCLLLERLSTDFFVNHDATLREYSSSQFFQAVYIPTSIKVDFHAGAAVHGELERSVLKEIFPGLKVPITTRVDAILSKLIWIKKGSHKSRQDVRMMYNAGSETDKLQTQKQAAAMGLGEILEEVLTAKID